MSTPFLAGEHIDLRPLELADVSDRYLHWFHDEEVCRYNSHHRFPMSAEALHAYVQSVMVSKDSIVLAIIDKVTRTHVGNISLQSIDWIARSAELAILIGEKDFWGKGIGREASALLITHGFDQLDLNRIWMGTMEENAGMLKIAEKLGFLREGVLREANYKNGAFSNGIILGLLRSDFKA